MKVVDSIKIFFSYITTNESESFCDRCSKIAKYIFSAAKTHVVSIKNWVVSVRDNNASSLTNLFNKVFKANTQEIILNENLQTLAKLAKDAAKAGEQRLDRIKYENYDMDI